MQKRGQNYSLSYGGGVFLIFFGAWLFSQYDGGIKLFGVVLIALGMGLIASTWR